MDKPYSQACENNKHAILEVLEQHLQGRERLLEIGAGTGQHAAWFAPRLPWLQWQPTDVPAHLHGIEQWCEPARSSHSASNLLMSLPLDVNDETWPMLTLAADAAFTANTLHIMAWPEVERLFAKLGDILSPTATLIVYGPFLYDDQPTAPSNLNFDQRLREQTPHRGIRRFADVDALAQLAGFTLQDDIAMPANNRTLIWKRGE